MSFLLDLLIAVALIVGAGFALIGSIGLARFNDFYSRLHGPTKATTLGVGGMLVASAVYFSTRGDGVSLHELLVAAFLFFTAPVSAQLMARVAMHLRVPTPVDVSGTAGSHADAFADEVRPTDPSGPL
jgi:multicomponent K+:H+ antiporter subunit G